MSQRLENIDVLRGLAAIGVAWFHIYMQNTSSEFKGNSPEILNLISVWGRFGVQLFFVISGFVIAYTLVRRPDFRRFIDIPIYLIRRIIRLDFLYWFILFLYLAAFLLFGPDHGVGVAGFGDEVEISLASITKNLFYFLPIQSSLLIPVAWTLAIEVQFYLFMASIIVLLRMFGLGSRGIGIFLVGISFISLAFPLSIIPGEVGFWLFPSLYQLLLGTSVFFLIFSKEWPVRVLHCIFIISIICVSLATYDSYVIASAISALVVIAALKAPENVVPLQRVFLNLGQSSYSIYLIHPLVGWLIVGWFAKSNFTHHFWPGLLLVVSGILISWALSFFLYRTIERPSIRLSRAFQDRILPSTFVSRAQAKSY